MASPMTSRDWKLAKLDLARGVAAWHIWLPFGLSDIRQRYLRSHLGQFWISISTAVFIIGIGVLYSVLFKMRLTEYLPYLTVNFIVWTFMAGMINDSTIAFVEATAYLRQDALPKTIYIMRVLVRNLTAFAHNLVIVPPVFFVFGVKPSLVIFLALPGLLVLLVAAFLVVLASSLLCTRFRDFPQVVQSILQIAFFATPVMWSADQMGEMGWYFSHLNPFAIFLALVAEPLRGIVPSPDIYLGAGIVIAVLLVLTWPCFVRYRARIVYWL